MNEQNTCLQALIQLNETVLAYAKALRNAYTVLFITVTIIAVKFKSTNHTTVAIACSLFAGVFASEAYAEHSAVIIYEELLQSLQKRNKYII